LLYKVMRKLVRDSRCARAFVRWAKETRWSGREIGKRIFGSGGYRQWVLEKEGGEALVRAGIEKVAELVREVSQETSRPSLTGRRA